MRDFLVLAIAQALVCAVVVIGIRAIAAGNIEITIAIELLLASLNFLIMRRVAQCLAARWGFLGYLLGSLAGTAGGMLLARWVCL